MKASWVSLGMVAGDDIFNRIETSFRMKRKDGVHVRAAVSISQANSYAFPLLYKRGCRRIAGCQHREKWVEITGWNEWYTTKDLYDANSDLCFNHSSYDVVNVMKYAPNGPSFELKSTPARFGYDAACFSSNLSSLLYLAVVYSSHMLQSNSICTDASRSRAPFR